VGITDKLAGRSRTIGRVQTDVLILVQTVEFFDLIGGQFEIVHVNVCDDPLLGIGLRQRDESEGSASNPRFS
jgi:hypothetical protein